MQHLDHALLEELRHAPRCEACGVAVVGFCEPHHMASRGMGGHARLDVRFLMASLCFECHHSYHYSRKPTEKKLWEKISAREAIPVAELKGRLVRLRRAPKECVLCHHCKGYGEYEIACPPGGLCLCWNCDGFGILLNGAPYDDQGSESPHWDRPAVHDDLERGQGQDTHDGLPPATPLPGAVGPARLESDPGRDEWVAF